MSLADTLRKIKVFKGLTAEEIDVIEKLGEERTYKAGTIVLKESNAATDFYICIEGELVIQINVPGRGVITTRTIGGNNIFGWSALANIPHFGASVRTTKDSRVLVFSGPKLNEIFMKHPRIGYYVMRNLINIVSTRLQDVRFALASCIMDYRKS